MILITPIANKEAVLTTLEVCGFWPSTIRVRGGKLTCRLGDRSCSHTLDKFFLLRGDVVSVFEPFDYKGFIQAINPVSGIGFYEGSISTLLKLGTIRRDDVMSYILAQCKLPVLIDGDYKAVWVNNTDTFVAVRSDYPFSSVDRNNMPQIYGAGKTLEEAMERRLHEGSKDE